MAIVGRILGFVVGVGLGTIGLLLWGISNDGPGVGIPETVLKLISGGSLLGGALLILIAVLPGKAARVPGSDNSPQI